MDQGTLSTADPAHISSRVERRRRFRHRLNSPVYATFKSPQAGMVVDLSELLDLSEDGFSVHTPEPLETDRPLALTLDLPETRTYLHGHGVAIWSDASGRGGVRFSDLSDTSRRLLKEWLFSNLLVAAANHEARSEQRARQDEAANETAPEPRQPVADPSLPAGPVLDAAAAPPSEMPVLGLSPIDALREQIRAVAGDPAPALNLVTNYACQWTGASGAALALRTGQQMICCARAGDTAPPLGTPVDTNHGLSGECVRAALIVHSDDTENDPRVDAETCRALGIGSVLAVPIVTDYRVVGLLEVFAPHPRAFQAQHATLLEHLIELIPLQQALHPEAVQPVEVHSNRSEPLSEPPFSVADPAPQTTVPEPSKISEPTPAAIKEPETKLGVQSTKSTISRASYLALVALSAVLSIAAGYLLAPTIQSRWLADADQSTAAAAAPQLTRSRADSLTSPEELRKLADSGDAEAQYTIGIRYGTGAGVVQNEVQAAKWFQRAAEQGHVQAQARLASYYWSGRGVPKDLSTAYFWAALASAQGDENSKLLLEGLSSLMAPSQKIAAQRQAENWFHQHNQQATAKN